MTIIKNDENQILMPLKHLREHNLSLEAKGLLSAMVLLADDSGRVSMESILSCSNDSCYDVNNILNEIAKWSQLTVPEFLERGVNLLYE